MISIREGVEYLIWWKVTIGNLSFWYNNWIKQDALYYVEGEIFQDEEIEVSKFIRNGKWDRQLLLNSVSEEMVELIIQTIKPYMEGHENNKPWWR